MSGSLMRLGKAYRDVVRGFRGEFENPPDLVAFPQGRVGDRGGALLGRGRGGGGCSVWGWDERGRWGGGAAWRAAGGLARPEAAGSGAGGRCGVVGGADPGRGHRAGAGGPAARARVDAAALSAVVRVLDPGRLDRDPGRGALRDALHAHRRPGRVGAGDHAAGDLGEPAAAGLRRRALARPGADRLRGDPRGDRRGLGAGAAAAPASRPPAGSSSTTSSPRRGRCARSRSRACIPSNCRLLDALEAGTTGAGSGETNLLVLGFESATPAGRRADAPGARHRPVPRRRPQLAAAGTRSHAAEAGRRRRRSRRRSRAGAGPSCSRPTCATPSSPAACSARPSRRRSPGTASRSSTPRRWRRCGAKVAEVCDAPAEGPGAPRVSCRFTHVYPDGPAPYFTVLAPGGPRRRGRAVGRDQGRGRRGADRGRRHDHPPPRGRPRSPPLV